MARIRTIKPDFFTSEQIVECSTNARLLFVGLWCFCDDQGVHPVSARRLKMEVFPGDDDITTAKVSAMMGELIKAGLVTEFSADGERFWAVTGWKRHQRIDRPNAKYPCPPASHFDEHSTSDQRAITEDSTSDHPRKGMEWNGDGMEKEELVAYTPPEREQDAPKPDRTRKPKTATDQPAPPNHSSNGFKRVRDILIEDPVIAPPDEDTERTRREQLKRLQEGRKQQ